MKPRTELRVEIIPVDNITIVNPRGRGRGKFREIVDSISRLGLKRPITVAKRNGRKGPAQYDLLCGQGRLEAYKALGQTEVQAVVIEANKEELMLMSLTENPARRVRTATDMMQSIVVLKDAGHSYADIARKTGLEASYVKGIVKLMSKGEDRLIRAVEQGVIPITVAMTIATSDDADVQRVLAEAYESNTLRGKQLLRARRIIDQRRKLGKNREAKVASPPQRSGPTQILDAYHEEAAEQRLLVRRAKACETRLLFIIWALQQLVQDHAFVKLLREQGLNTMPKPLAERVFGQGPS